MRGPFAIVFVVACWHSPPPQAPIPPPEPPSVTLRPTHRPVPPCVRAIDHALEVVRPELERITNIRERILLLRDAALESCEATGWSDDSLACYETATDPNLMRCQATLTAEQRRDLDQRMTDVMTKPVP